MFIDYVYEYENPPIIAVKKHSIRWRILQEVISWAHQQSELHKIRALMHTMRLYGPAYFCYARVWIVCYIRGRRNACSLSVMYCSETILLKSQQWESHPSPLNPSSTGLRQSQDHTDFSSWVVCCDIGSGHSRLSWQQRVFACVFVWNWLM